jgi:hypothetical protein
MASAIEHGNPLQPAALQATVARFDWQAMAPLYDDRLEGVAEGR